MALPVASQKPQQDIGHDTESSKLINTSNRDTSATNLLSLRTDSIINVCSVPDWLLPQPKTCSSL